MPHSNDVQDAIVSAEDPGGLSTTPASVRGISLQQAADILVRAVKEAQCCEGILRSHVVNLEAELEAARKEAADSRRIAEEAKAENQQLKAKAESLGKLVAKQQQVIAEHEGRLRAFSARTVGAMLARKNGGGVKRPRLADHEGSPKKVPEQVKGEPSKTGKGKVLEDKTNLMGKAALAPFRSLTPAPKLLEAERQKLPECNEFKPSFEGSAERSEREKSENLTESTKMALPKSKEMVSDAEDTEDAEDAEDGRPPECDSRAGRAETESSSSLKVAQVAQVAGLRIWGGRDSRRFVPKEREEAGQTERTLDKLEEQSERSERSEAGQAAFQIVQAPPAFTRSGSFEHRVWAEGHSALTSSNVKEGVPCRCVVRGKAQRSALHGFDCEQCRNFYAATKHINGIKQSGPKGDDLKASRHRMDHAPTCTPPGFWDLSFPHPDARS